MTPLANLNVRVQSVHLDRVVFDVNGEAFVVTAAVRDFARLMADATPLRFCTESNGYVGLDVPPLRIIEVRRDGGTTGRVVFAFDHKRCPTTGGSVFSVGVDDMRDFARLMAEGTRLALFVDDRLTLGVDDGGTP